MNQINEDLRESVFWKIIKTSLKPNEQILWSGKPDAKIFFHAADTIIIPFGLVFALFAVFWEWKVLHINVNAGPVMSVLFASFGVIFIAVGVYASIGRLFADNFMKKRTLYVLTNKRALIVTVFMKQKIQSIPLDKVEDIVRNCNKRGIGWIKFGQDRVFYGNNFGFTYNPVLGYPQHNFGNSSYVHRAPGFYDIDDVEKVYNLIKQIQKDQ